MSGGSHKAGLLSGPKISNKHTTVIIGAEAVVRALKADAAVSRVVISVIRHIRGSSVSRSVKATRIDAGLKVVVRAGSAVQDFYAYTSESDAVLARLDGLAVRPAARGGASSTTREQENER